LKKYKIGFLFRVTIMLDDVSPENVLAELCAEPGNDGAIVRINMEKDREVTHHGEYHYHAKVSGVRAVEDYTVRIIANYKHIAAIGK
jgi:hypothetical protein